MIATLFGSRLYGTHSVNSDWDFLVSDAELLSRLSLPLSYKSYSTAEERYRSESAWSLQFYREFGGDAEMISLKKRILSSHDFGGQIVSLDDLDILLHIPKSTDERTWAIRMKLSYELPMFDAGLVALIREGIGTDREDWPAGLRAALGGCRRSKRGSTLVSWLQGHGIEVPSWYRETPVLGVIERRWSETRLLAWKTGLE